MQELGVYIHFPFCRKLCPYCDFAVAVWPAERVPHDDYTAAVLRELDDRAGDHPGRVLVSIYFGGGTPSLWRPDALARVITAVCARFGADPAGLEVTLEVNPDDCTAANLKRWREIGINRLSIGVQSYDPGALRVLGRDHLGDGPAALAAAREAGFPSVSADLILGTPGRPVGPDALDGSVPQIAASGVDHISVYELTIEERTAFGRAAARGTFRPTDPDRLAEMYVATHEALTARGFEHYEVSSYALPGWRGRHNALYWRGAEFLGLGNGAASLWRDPHGGGRRVTNVRAVKRYLRAAGHPDVAARAAARRAEVQEIAPDELARELVWLGMRTVDGVAEDTLDGLPGICAWLLGAGLAVAEAGRIRPTLRGFLYADQIAARVV